MKRTIRARPLLVVALALFSFFAVTDNRVRAEKIMLKDGRVLEGKRTPLAGLNEVPQPPSPDGTGPLQLIIAMNDGLRRTFVSKRQIQDYRQDDPTEILEKFPIRQRVIHSGPTVGRLGIFQTEPFDEYGRRVVRMLTDRGPVDIIQAITEITPPWIKIEGVKHVWDMRLATSAMPRDALATILNRQIDPKNIEHRKKLARFYLQADRYEEAAAELEQILADFADDPDVREQLQPSLRSLKQLGAQRLLDELKTRREAGQHQMVTQALASFPTDGVAGEILQAVREMLQEYETYQSDRAETLARFDALVEKVGDSALRLRILRVREEIGKELNINTFRRMAAFRQLVDDESLTPEERLALAVSGWLLGADAATVKLPVALSVYDVRDLVRRYVNTDDVPGRTAILEGIKHEEGSVPSMVAKLLSHMKPPVVTPPELDEGLGYFTLEVPGRGNSLPVPYLVQLPPEYDPLRSYPTVVTLHAVETTPEQQIDWWAGAWSDDNQRNGQATRRGYIVIAPAWTSEHQRKYEYSAREHAAVLDCLRDACRRFAIDTDRVYLSGFSMGGDAAWDIGLAHPDLWAGVIPFAAVSSRYCSFYWENAKLVPFYFVDGELDGDHTPTNAMDLDRYLRRGYDATVVEFLGRGCEHFSDEILRVFDWMALKKRNFYPREFTVSSMRPWDNFFWWVELDEMPPRTIVYPADWPPPRGTMAAETTASITAANGLYVRTAAGKITLWISPEMLDFDRRATITVNGNRVNAKPFIEADLETLLEDARTRADRRHPFWCKLESGTGRFPPRR